MLQATYSKARAEFAQLLNAAGQDNELIVIERRGKEPVAMIALAELQGLTETAHLLRSPRNRERLLTALERSSNHSQATAPMDVNELAELVGLV